MAFSSEWEKIYLSNTHLSIWPWTDIVSLVNRHCKHLISKKNVKVLELGCGAGANIPFFLSLGFYYNAIEGSPAICKILHDRFPNLVNNIRNGDFTSSDHFGNGYDLVIDRASLTHNSTQSINCALSNVFNSLSKGGLFIGSDWFSIKHSEYGFGEPGSDLYTRCNYLNGPFSGIGNVHFSDEEHLREMLHRFDIMFIEEKYIKRVEPKTNYIFSSWNFVAVKT